MTNHFSNLQLEKVIKDLYPWIDRNSLRSLKNQIFSDLAGYEITTSLDFDFDLINQMSPRDLIKSIDNSYARYRNRRDKKM
jgi:hypothetical protein